MQKIIRQKMAPHDVEHVINLYLTKLKTHKGLPTLDVSTSQKYCDSFKDTSVWADYPDLNKVSDVMNLRLEQIMWEGFENRMLEKVDFKFANLP